jgi:hypothetical protein
MTIDHLHLSSDVRHRHVWHTCIQFITQEQRLYIERRESDGVISNRTSARFMDDIYRTILQIRSWNTCPIFKRSNVVGRIALWYYGPWRNLKKKSTHDYKAKNSENMDNLKF